MTERRQSTVSCRGEGYLDDLTNRNVAFKVDVHSARSAVQLGSLSVPEAFDSLLPLSATQSQQMSECLDRIDSGMCPIYPLSARN